MTRIWWIVALLGLALVITPRFFPLVQTDVDNLSSVESVSNIQPDLVLPEPPAVATQPVAQPVVDQVSDRSISTKKKNSKQF